jgi:hypothetical protein
MCAGGFRNVGVTKTRILQDGSVALTDLSTSEHRFRCCIDPSVRMTIEVQKNKYSFGGSPDCLDFRTC